MHDGRQDNENVRSGRTTIQRSGMGKQYESFNDKGGLDEPDYEAIAKGIERVKRDHQEKIDCYYRTAQEEHERRKAEALSKIETNQRAIEQVRVIVQKRIKRYKEVQKYCGKEINI